jgi:uncharacterized protein (TIGR03083 family)
MSALDAASISIVLDVLQPERSALLELLSTLDEEQWSRATECPEYDVKGVATHVLGDDLSLLSRQRDEAQSGLIGVAMEMPGTDFRTILDTFNDRWVVAAKFLSPALLIELLRLTGESTEAYYRQVDPLAPCEPVMFFGSRGEVSPFWQAIAREYMERWVHHSQIRRALGLGSLDTEPFLPVGARIAAASAGIDPWQPPAAGGDWVLGPVVLGAAPVAAAILSKGHTADEITALATGPADAVAFLAQFAGR